MKRNLLYILGVVCLMTSCVEERIKEFEAAPGVEVDFNISMADGPETKTLYGAESTDGKSIKVNWVTGDLVEIYGTNCSVNQAEYKVTAQDTPTNVAKSLDKTVDVGVRWGDSGTSDFYALYPSDGASFTENTDGTVTLKTTISEKQNNVFTLNEARTVKLKETVGGVEKTYDIPVWEGTHFADDATNPSMPSAIMYACTKGAAAKDDQGNLQPVSLHFKPFTTVLKFRFMGYTSSLTDPTVYVQNIVVEAPKGYDIAGDFNLGISGTGSGATATATSANTTAKNVITLNTILPGGTYLPLKQRQAVEFNVFTMPVDGQEMGKTADSNLWKITINTAQHGSFSYTLAPTADGTVYELEPGKIHKVKVPQLPVNGTIDWEPENWITQIPAPVYISELSVPGAWYCFDSGYQNTTDLETLYKAGIRAFNIDCRITKKGDTNDAWTITGKYEAEWNDSKDYPDNAYLACSGTETDQVIGFIGDLKYNIIDGTYVQTAVQDIVTLAKGHPAEYVVIVFTFAEKPKTVSGNIYGSVNPIWIMNELNTILNTSGIKEYLYTNITKDTTIDDITKKQSDGYVKNVIVKINHCIDGFYTSLASVDNDNNTNTATKSVIPAGLMGSFGSMSSDETYNPADTTTTNNISTATGDLITDIAGLHGEKEYEDYFTTIRFNDIYIGSDKSDMVYCYHQAQKTSSSQTRGQTGTGIPTLGMRMDAIDDIIAQSKTVYDNAHHDHWFQLGIGGSIDGSDQSGVSNVLNPYVNKLIQDKMNTDPSPVGIVLMNHCTADRQITNEDGTTSTKENDGIDLVYSIIEMNGKFYLNRQGGSITTGGQGGTDTTNPTPAPAKNVAYAVVGDDAF